MKRLKLLLVMVLSFVSLVGCSSNKLSDAFDEEKLKTSSQEIIQMLCNEDYDKIEEKSSKELIDAGVIEKLREVWQSVAEKLGTFDSCEKQVVIGKDNQATVVTIAKFKDGKAQFTITYNEDMKLIGFYIK